MSRFRFRLQRILDLRAEREKERARVLGRAVRDAEARKSDLDTAAARLDQCGEQLVTRPGHVATAGAMRNLGLTVRAAAEAVAHAEQSYEDAEQNVRAERKLFGEARKERRVVERLRERRHTAWREDELRQEQKEIDGIAVRRRSPGKGNR
jgi:flagellar FliJ protein